MVHSEVFPGVTEVNSVAVFVGSHIGTPAEPELQTVFTSSVCETFFLLWVLRRCNTTLETSRQNTNSTGMDTHKLCTHSETQTGQTCLIYVSHTGPNLPFFSSNCRSNINADICFFTNIPKMTSYFPQTENAIAMCVCVLPFPTLQLLLRVPATFKIYQCIRTYVQQFVSSPEGCKLKNTWLLCAGLWRGEVTASRSVSGYVT